MRQFVYTMFITYNRALFHLWWKENLVKHQKVTKYYAHDCKCTKARQHIVLCHCVISKLHIRYNIQSKESWMHCSVKSFCRCQIACLYFRDSSASIFKNAFNFPSHIVHVNEKVSGNNEVETLMTLLES